MPDDQHGWERALLKAETALFEERKLNALMRREGGLVVNALDRALQWGEALFAFLPAGTPLSPAVSGCKQQLDQALDAVFPLRRQAWPNSVGNTSSSPPAKPSSASTPSAPMAGSLPVSTPSADTPSSSVPLKQPSTKPPTTTTDLRCRLATQMHPNNISLQQEALAEINHLDRAIKIAGQNIVELTDQRTMLTEALVNALTLITQMMDNMRVQGVVPSPITVAAKARLDQTMRELLEGKQ